VLPRRLLAPDRQRWLRASGHGRHGVGAVHVELRLV
jgi:hypothetical protein